MLPTIVVLALVSFTDVLDDVVPPLLESGILHKIAVKESVITDEKEVKSTDRSGSKQIAAQQIQRANFAI